MSVNRYQPHVLVLPEDDANRQLANGFLLDQLLSTRKIQVLEEVGGWSEVLNRFKSDHIYEMDRYDKRFMVLLIDFDGQEGRLDNAKAIVPDRLKGRVFVLGTWSEPEVLRHELGSYEVIGLAMAKDCREGTDTIWSHRLLLHNQSELSRLREYVRPILF
ncbi:MAG: hypothetical protein ACREX3_24470 [Gammaproteobacteria bacterium]